jgi:hypothetical protein
MCEINRCHHDPVVADRVRDLGIHTAGVDDPIDSGDPLAHRLSPMNGFPPKNQRSRVSHTINGAGEGNRTPDLLITSVTLAVTACPDQVQIALSGRNESKTSAQF